VRNWYNTVLHVLFFQPVFETSFIESSKHQYTQWLILLWHRSGVSFNNFRQFAFRLLLNDTIVISGVAFLGVRLIWKISSWNIFSDVKTWKKAYWIIFIFSALLQTDLRANWHYVDQNYYLGIKRTRTLLSVAVTWNTPSIRLQYGIPAVLVDSCVAIFSNSLFGIKYYLFFLFCLNVLLHCLLCLLNRPTLFFDLASAQYRATCIQAIRFWGFSSCFEKWCREGKCCQTLSQALNWEDQVSCVYVPLRYVVPSVFLCSGQREISGALLLRMRNVVETIKHAFYVQ
jgi:hypothetical protein